MSDPTPDPTAFTSETLEVEPRGRWNAVYLGHASDYHETREAALEALRRKIAGACYAAGVVVVETVDLGLDRC